MAESLTGQWLHQRASLGAATNWTADEIRIVAELGHALVEQGRNLEALTIFDGLAALSPGTAYFRAVIGAIHLRLGDFQTACRHLDTALSMNNEDVLSLINRGEAYINVGMRAAAAADLRAALQLADAQSWDANSSPVKRARSLLTFLERSK